MLPHQQPIPGDACFFLTLNTVDKIDLFTRPACKQIIANALNHFIDTHGLRVYAWCLMTSHLHLLIQTKESQSPAVFERDFKKYTTPELIKTIEMEIDLRRDWMLQRFEDFGKSLKKIEKFHVWQSCSSPLHIDRRQPRLLLERIDQIHQNPVRDQVVEMAENYMFSSARDYAGMQGLVRVTVLQQQGSSRFKTLSPN